MKNIPLMFITSCSFQFRKLWRFYFEKSSALNQDMFETFRWNGLERIIIQVDDVKRDPWRSAGRPWTKSQSSAVCIHLRLGYHTICELLPGQAEETSCKNAQARSLLTVCSGANADRASITLGAPNGHCSTDTSVSKTTQHALRGWSKSYCNPAPGSRF